MGLLAVVALRTADDERRSARALRESGAVLYADEAGLRSTLGAWPTTAVKALNPGDSLSLGWQLLPNGASHRVVIHRVDKGGLYEYAVVAQAKGAGALGGRSTLVQMVSAVSVYRWGLFTETGITLTGGSATDSYDSRNGPYNPFAPDSSGSVATNGSVVMSGTSTIVKGDAAAVGSVTGAVTGSTTNGAAPFPHMPDLACPTGGYTSSLPRGHGISYNPVTGALRVDGGGNLTLTAPPAQYYFSEVVLTGGSTLTVNAGGQHVDVYIGKKLDISGGGIVKTSAQPTQLGFSACGTPGSSEQWTLTGGSGAYFSVYAPSHPVVVTGGGNLWGAVVGASYTASGGSKLHYDEALAQIPSKLLTVVTGSWAQLGVN